MNGFDSRTQAARSLGRVLDRLSRTLAEAEPYGEEITVLGLAPDGGDTADSLERLRALLQRLQSDSRFAYLTEELSPNIQRFVDVTGNIVKNRLDVFKRIDTSSDIIDQVEGVLSEIQDVILGEAFFDAIRNHDRDKVEALLAEEALDVNMVHERTGYTGLHLAAISGDWRMVAMLETRADLDYLVQDNRDEFPSEKAFRVEHPRALELANRLLDKEIEAAGRRGLDYKEMVLRPR